MSKLCYNFFKTKKIKGGNDVLSLIGVFIMSVLKTGLPFVGVQPHYQLLITGFVLIIAVFVDVLNRRKQGKN